MGKTEMDGNKRFRYVIIALLLVFLVSAALLVLSIWDRVQGSFSDPGHLDTTLQYNGKEYVLKDNVETFLVMGLDKTQEAVSSDSYKNDQQADFLMLFVYDNDAKTCTAVHINRDTMANVNILGINGNKVDTVVKQIALSHTYGNGRDVSCRNTADAVSELLLGMKINHYISVTMDSVGIFNDLVGGVEVTILDDFTGIDDALIKGEVVTLNGEQALTYVRSRYGLDDSTNVHRMERQQQYLRALYQKTIHCINEDESFIVKASLKMSDYIITDRSVTQLQAQAKKLAEYEFTDILSIQGESKVGEKFMEFYPNDDSIMEIVIELFYEPKH